MVSDTARLIWSWVAVATIAYIGLQAYYLIKNKGKRALLDG